MGLEGMRLQEFYACFDEYVEDNSNGLDTKLNFDDNDNYDHLS